MSHRSEEFTYPSDAETLVQAYGGRYECAFIMLHPFVRVPNELSWNAVGHYPEDAQIAAQGAKCCWIEVAEETGLKTCARLNHALLTSIGSLQEDAADYQGLDQLQRFLETRLIWMPVEGRFEPLLQRDFLATFTEAGAEELIYVPEFPQSEPVVRLPLEGLRCGEIPFPMRGTLLAENAEFLFTVDWDSFFTLLCGSREFVERIAAARHLEGFFATTNTEHAWWNHSFGCATVTLSPEHWQPR